MSSAIIFNVAQGISDFECHNLVSKVTMKRVFPEKTPKVFIKGNEDTQLYIRSYNDNDSCSSEYRQVEVKELNIRPVETEPQTRIHRKCERQYVPLRERTKTLDDLKKEDLTENREKAAPYIKRYEDRRKRIMNEKANP
jgi:hypothetical protein